MGLWYPKDSGFELTTFLDADHTGCLDTWKSTFGGIQFLGDKLVSWMSKKQNCTAMSLAEAEYVALSASCAQVMWMRTQLQDYGFNYNKIPLYCDSQSAIAISCNPVQHSRTKIIHTRYHFIKEQVENGIIELYFVRTEYQLADMFTKALPEDRFKYLVRRIGMRCLTPADLEFLEEVKDFHTEDGGIEDDILREKLSKINLLIAKFEAIYSNPPLSFDFVTKSPSTFPNSFLEETNTFDNSIPESETFCFDLEENSSGSTTTRSDESLPDYEAFYFDDDHIEEKSSYSTTTHSDISLSKYDSFVFDLSINLFPPADRSDIYHEEIADELVHIISPPEYDCVSLKILS
ncbi:hypothetical protein Tco_0733121 [Tanacetum coccineum]